MKEAIQKAIEGGYKLPNDTDYSASYVKIKNVRGRTTDFVFGQFGSQCLGTIPTADILLDPLFWQALGKAMGWEFRSDHKEPWKKEWHRFIDHLAEGKDVESFFKDLLK